MPNQVMHPALSQLLPLHKVPNEIEALRDALEAIFDDIFIKDLISSQNPDGSSGFYSMKITSYNGVGIDLKIAEDLKLVINPTSVGATEIPLQFSYSWLILRYINNFNSSSFDNAVDSLLQILYDLAGFNQKTFLKELIASFYQGPTSIDDFITSFNAANPNTISSPPSNSSWDSKIDNISAQISRSNKDLIAFAYNTNINVNGEGIERLKKLFSSYFTDIQQRIKEAIQLNFTATINEIGLGLQFPRNWLTPVYTGSEPVSGLAIDDPLPEPYFSYLYFDAGSLRYTSDKGFQFDNVNSFSLSRSMIGNTGIIAEFSGLKVDLSREKNIPEATLDDRPANFLGAYADYAAITLPKSWFKQEDNQTLQIGARNFLVGTGGVSGTVILETENGTPSQGDDFLWFRIGSNDGFKVGFSRFDMTFKQNKVVSSNISGGLEIKNFTYPPEHPDRGDDVRILVTGHIQDDGAFNLTAATQAFPIELEDVFTYDMKTVELGRQSDGDFYIGTSGTLQFEGLLRDVLKLGPIEIDRLRIYSDGSMEFDGGSINLVEPVVLPLGPADITVTAIHYGSHQKEVNGVMRKFNYFGFDGGINVDPLGVEIRGDGVKYYYCSDDLPNKPQPYLHIQTLHLDLTIPANTPVAIINGWLSIPEPGTSPEYAGGVKIQLPKAKITGSAGMKLAPKYPAFLIDASIEFPAPIPLGTFAIYGFRGLLGYRYVAEKEAVGLVSGVDTWYDYYKVPERGINERKFSGPNQTSSVQDPFSIGAGASLGTSFDNGTVLNLKAMVLLSVPSLFMLDGRAAIISARLGLDSTQDPPFFAFAAIGDNSLEFGFGADFKLPKTTGSIVKLYADVQAAFFFNNPSKWYVNFGTKDNPTRAEILQLITLKSYLMLSAKGIEAGARGEFDFRRTYAGIVKVHAWAYVEIGGKISFEKPQFGAYLDAGVGAKINVKFVELSASFQILFAVEASQPYLIYGKVRIKIKIRILWVFKFSFDQDVEVLWEKSKNVDRTPINPLINSSNTAAIPQIVKGVNMLSNETFELAYLGNSIPATLSTAITEHIIPLDTYIDIKTEKALLPGAMGNLIGGVSNPPSSYTDLVPPDKVVKGKELRQVKHQYSLENLVIKSWRPASQAAPGGWEDYHPYKALYPDDQSSSFDNLKIGQFQKSDGRYNTVRLLATTPFSYTEQGEPGWYIPEQYGLTPGTLFCEGERLLPQCADFIDKPLSQYYYFFDGNQMIYSNQAAFLMLNTNDYDHAEVTDQTNIFGFEKSLAFANKNPMQTLLPKPSVYVSLKLTSDSQGVRVKYFAPLINDLALEVQYGNPDPNAINQNEPYTVLLDSSQLSEAIIYDKPTWRAITKIVIEPLYPNQLLIDSLVSQIGSINNVNNQIELGLASGNPQSPSPFINDLNLINNQNGFISSQGFIFNFNKNDYYLSGGNGNPIKAWDYSSGHKVKGNPFGFMIDGNNITIESDHQLLGVKLFPEFPTLRYDIINEGRKVVVRTDDIRDFTEEDIHLEVDVFETACKNDKDLCSLHTSLLEVYNNCLIDPTVIKESEIPTVAKCIDSCYTLIYDFDKKYPDYRILDLYVNEIKDIETFRASQTLENYILAYNALTSIINALNQTGGCNCGCDKDESLCKLYSDLESIYDSCLISPSFVREENLADLYKCMKAYLAFISEFVNNYPGYELDKIYVDEIKVINKFQSYLTIENYADAYNSVITVLNGINTLGNCDCSAGDPDTVEDLFNNISDIFDSCFPDISELFDFTNQVGCVQDIIDFLNDFDVSNPEYDIIKGLGGDIDLLLEFIANPNSGTYQEAIIAIGHILDYLNELGHYAFDKLPNKTLLHQVCWLSLEDYEYNLNIPSQEAISEDAQAAVDGITKYIQPVWRPDTSYIVQFVLKDTVDNGENEQLYPFTYGFTTGGPVGYFHTHPQSTYGGNQISNNPDAFALTSLRQYIDYERSYPNADGNLLSAKPLFYNDETSQIYLFFSKAYATHFFNNWQAYNGKDAVNGRMKIVIKDPVEGTEIVNPPYLDYDENDITTIHIPQTVEEWRDDLFPPVPFVISQWANLYRVNNCIIVGADPIKPASKFISIALKHLKPEKLYTAIVNNLYDSDGNGAFSDIDETKEVHKFVFKTSRYANFAEQINSYLLSEGTGEEYISKQAVFSITKPFTSQQVDMAYKTITGQANAADSFIGQYQHAYDRVFEGVLGLEPLDEAISTEFNFIKNSNDDKVIAVIIRNPEPFNIPRIPISEIMDTIQVMNGSSPDTNYKVLFSKDYSQAIIMHSSQSIISPSLSIKFRYKIWNGYSYEESGNVPAITIDVL